MSQEKFICRHCGQSISNDDLIKEYRNMNHYAYCPKCGNLLGHSGDN